MGGILRPTSLRRERRPRLSGLDAANIVDLVGLIPPGDQAQIGADVSRSADARRIIDRGDEGENANRHVQAGNPYGKLIAGLMKQAVQIGLCGATAETNHWINANLLPGVIVDTNAMVLG